MHRTKNQNFHGCNHNCRDKEIFIRLNDFKDKFEDEDERIRSIAHAIMRWDEVNCECDDQRSCLGCASRNAAYALLSLLTEVMRREITGQVPLPGWPFCSPLAAKEA